MPLHNTTAITSYPSEDVLESKLKQHMLEYQGRENRTSNPFFNIVSDQAPNLPCDAEARCVITHLPSIVDVIQGSGSQTEAVEILMAMPDSQIADAARFNELLSTTRNEFIKTSMKRAVCERLYDMLRRYNYMGQIESRDRSRT